MNTDTVGSVSAGRRFELMIFGETFQLSEKEVRRVPRFSFEESLKNAEAVAIEKFRAGTWDPGSPPTMTALELQQAVQNALRLRTFILVELVNALGTTMDIHWGVDGYFRLAGTRTIVTFDLTTNYGKVRLGYTKADLFLTPADLSSKTALKGFARKVANLLRQRYKRVFIR